MKKLVGVFFAAVVVLAGGYAWHKNQSAPATIVTAPAGTNQDALVKENITTTPLTSITTKSNNTSASNAPTPTKPLTGQPAAVFIERGGHIASSQIPTNKTRVVFFHRPSDKTNANLGDSRKVTVIVGE